MKFTKKITNQSINNFAKISGDNNFIHMNKKKAMINGFKDRVAHGALIISFFSKLIGKFLPVKKSLLLFIDVKFKNPAYPNNFIKINGIIKEIHLSTKCVQIDLTAKYYNGTIISSGKAIVKIN